ncbi:MAG: aminopeptidase N C-terminal domain-containing protein, partial [Devosia sp.]|nr:aminopeptidase N C-terminal domain-containing protein [Devosia sp.]
AWSDAQVDALAQALDDAATSETLDPAFKANALSLPAESLVARAIGREVDPDRIQVVRNQLLAAIAARIEGTLEQTCRQNAGTLPYSPDFRQAGQRSLRNAALSLLVTGRARNGPEFAREQYRTAANMTDRFAALTAIVAAWTPDAPALLGDFRTMYTADPLVFDKWLALNGMATDTAALDRIKALLADPAFPRNNPNRLRALVGTFGMNNPTQFARANGDGFRFLTEFVADVDQRNPQVAARVLTAFRVWRSFEPVRRAEAEKALKSLQESAELSRNTADILGRTLGG